MAVTGIAASLENTWYDTYEGKQGNNLDGRTNLLINRCCSRRRLGFVLLRFLVSRNKKWQGSFEKTTRDPNHHLPRQDLPFLRDRFLNLFEGSKASKAGACSRREITCLNFDKISR